MAKVTVDISQVTAGYLEEKLQDNSDVQFASFRNNYMPLLFALTTYILTSYLYKRFSASSSSAKLPSQFLSRIYFSLTFSLIFLYVLFGNSLIKILIILTLSYLISMIFKGSKLNPVITWIFNLTILFLNENYDGYRFEMLDERLGFLDLNKGLLPRWNITFNFSMLRIISYNMDYYWSFHSSNDTREKIDKNSSLLSDKSRIINPCFKEDYNYIYYLSYILYTPLYLAGPIITYNDFVSQFRYPKEQNFKSIISYGLRLFSAIILMEFMLHYMYVVAISKSGVYEGYTPFELAMIGAFNLKLIWLKLLIIWRFFRFWAMVDGIDTQENMLRCMFNNYSTQGFWRSWHRSYYRWIIRYIYIPLGGTKYAIYNILVVFTFVAIWHDITLSLLAWGWLIWLFILPEAIATKVFSGKGWTNWQYFRHLCAIGCVLNLLTMWAANLVGFAVGLDGMKFLLSEIFLTTDGLIALGLSCIAIFCAVQIMFEVREEEKRKGINSDNRY
ncbi:6449_t:CDS:10 [Entrophospora sp. SA101]|nr:6449_t:CDS:10 [Entrophospora sp. SA101]